MGIPVMKTVSHLFVLEATYFYLSSLSDFLSVCKSVLLSTLDRSATFNHDY